MTAAGHGAGAGAGAAVVGAAAAAAVALSMAACSCLYSLLLMLVLLQQRGCSRAGPPSLASPALIAILYVLAPAAGDVSAAENRMQCL